MAIHRQTPRAKVAAAARSSALEQHLLGAGVLALTLAVVAARLAA